MYSFGFPVTILQRLEAALEQLQTESQEQSASIRACLGRRQEAIESHMVAALDGFKHNLDSATECQNTLQDYRYPQSVTGSLIARKCTVVDIMCNVVGAASVLYSLLGKHRTVK